MIETPSDTAEASDTEGAIELVMGLGNPGGSYSQTRHNVGFRVVEILADRLAREPWIRRPLCDLTTAWIGPRLILARPRTFMNRVGTAGVWLLDHFELYPPQMLVVVDDVDLPLGTLRLRPTGGAGTHNGLRDLCARIGTTFPRLRVGVRGSDPRNDLAEYVLSPFSEDETAIADTILSRAADAVETALEQGITPAMSRYNGPLPIPADPCE